MKSEKIFKPLVHKKSTYTDQISKTIDYYQAVNDIIQRTYLAIGRKKMNQVSTVSLTKGKFNLK